MERACKYSKLELVLTICPLVCKVNSFHNFAVDLLRGIVIYIASHVPQEIDLWLLVMYKLLWLSSVFAFKFSYLQKVES